MDIRAHAHEIIATIKELVKLDPFFKEQFVVLLERVCWSALGARLLTLLLTLIDRCARP
jgi:hypothetical protein